MWIILSEESKTKIRQNKTSVRNHFLSVFNKMIPDIKGAWINIDVARGIALAFYVEGQKVVYEPDKMENNF
jgi:hypothetical protein